MKQSNRGSPLTTEEREDLVRLIDSESMSTLREESGLSRTALLSAAIGQPIIAGTRRLVRDLLERFAADEDDYGEEDDSDLSEESDDDPDDDAAVNADDDEDDR